LTAESNTSAIARSGSVSFETPTPIRFTITRKYQIKKTWHPDCSSR
jgi:hypothetical protein